MGWGICTFIGVDEGVSVVREDVLDLMVVEVRDLGPFRDQWGFVSHSQLPEEIVPSRP